MSQKQSYQKSVETLKNITIKIFELKQLIVDNPNYSDLNEQLEKELAILQEVDDSDEFFEEVAKQFI